MLRSSGPQTEAEEREALIFECGLLSGRAIRLTGHFPAALSALIDRPEGLDMGALTTPEIAALCAAIRAEFPGISDEADAAP